MPDNDILRSVQVEGLRQRQIVLSDSRTQTPMVGEAVGACKHEWRKRIA